MKQEIKALENKDNKKHWNMILNKHQDKYQSLKALFEKEKNNAQRRDIFHAHDMQNKAILQQSKDNTNVLKDAQKELHETDLNVVDIMDTLDEQTVQIKKIQQNVVESNNLLDNMGKTIKKMKRRWWA
eukprot:UN13002